MFTVIFAQFMVEWKRSGLDFYLSLRFGQRALDEMWEVPGQIRLENFTSGYLCETNKGLLAYCGMPELHLPEHRPCFSSLSLRVRRCDWNGGGGRSWSAGTSECKLNPSLSILLFLSRVSHCEDAV